MPKDSTVSLHTCGDLTRLINEAEALTCAVNETDHRAAVASLMRLALPHVGIPDFSDTPVNDGGYARKMLHIHPHGHFSVLAVRWMPGANTPVHGHNAWGCVGVLEGEIGCETYCCREDACECSMAFLSSTGLIRAGAGAVATVGANPEGIHRLFNPTEKEAITLHIYGMDLSRDPLAINVPYQH
ncbi:cysteine dioxygenase [Kordiimonas marina]|uniref:cysteine dioxygenase n=1 Tax=Kordiimonas marina TaxID=2872312 RepID=UPI001FF3EBF0|nr:cysteine dioxygenase family protein [Kordiimonas marina]MCJ9427660.1 cysteine dioxygenase family protein [Kordiimonas marina]